MIPGITAATAAVGSAHSFGERPKGSITACCTVRNGTDGGVAVLHMMKNRFVRGADALILRGYRSRGGMLMVQNVSASKEKVSKLPLRQVTFVPPTAFGFGPLVTVVSHGKWRPHAGKGGGRPPSAAEGHVNVQAGLAAEGEAH